MTNRLRLVTHSLIAFSLLVVNAPVLGSEAGSYEELIELFNELRAEARTGGEEGDLFPEVSPAAIDAEAEALERFQKRLESIDSSSWAVSRQIDYHLVRAELNGIEFKHRVTRPWFRDPGTYSDVVLFLGNDLPAELDSETRKHVRKVVASLPALFAQARVNLRNTASIPADLADLAIRDLDNADETFERLRGIAGDGDAEFVREMQLAVTASNELLTWLRQHRAEMNAAAGVGRENYDWLLKNVYLFPYTWAELRTMVELEDNRVIAFQRLEENRNRDVPRIEPVESQAEYQQSVADAIDDIMAFLRREEIFSVPDYLTPDEYFGSWHEFEMPWPDKHDYFFNFSHREPRMEEAHEMVGHYFDELRAEHNSHPIRKGWRPYKISTAREEGFAFALEEVLMHAGYLDKRSPRAREIVYEQAAFRTVRALADIYMHDNQWDLKEAMDFCVANAPHGHLLDDSPHLWFEMATTLRGVGHHMLMVVGKLQFMKLLRDRAQQQGDDFELDEFMDEFFDAGLIPFALTRWEMTGLDDEIKRLW